MRLMLIIIIFLSDINLNLLSNKLDELNLQSCIVQVHSGNAKSTGFIWKNKDLVVTNLHAIQDPQNIKIIISGYSPRDASLIRVLKKADLVLLKIHNSPAVEYISNIRNNVEFGEQAFCFGFAGESVVWTSRSFLVGASQYNKLNDIISSSSDRKKLKDLSFPDLDIKIIILDSGSLLYGYSGSPIVDSRNNLIAIADGGLDQGTTNRSWGIPVSYLSELENSSDIYSNFDLKIVKSLLSYENDIPSTHIQINYNGYVFEKIRNGVLFKDIDVATNFASVDQNGLSVALLAFRSFGVNYDEIKYDVYEEISTGAAILFPTGANPIVKNGLLTYTENDNSNIIELSYFITNTSDPHDAVINKFELNYSLSGYSSGWWVPDQAWSYSQFIKGPRGEQILRKSLVNYFYKASVFESFAIRNNIFLASFARRTVSNDSNINTWCKLSLPVQLMTYSK